MIVLTAPGLAGALSAEVSGLSGVRITDTGHDGRADLVLCEVDPGRERAILRLRTAEDVLVEFGRTLRSEGDRAAWIAKRLWRPSRVGAAVALWRAAGGGSGIPNYRVITRVLHEDSFRRTELRRALGAVVSAGEPRWRPADPARLELWALEYTAGRFVAGIRLSTVAMRQHGGRSRERAGALRPAVAAAMVQLAGDRPGELLDPCCGSGTILTEAVAAGWEAIGTDLDSHAVEAARQNARTVEIEVGDARRIALPDDAVDAVVSNLPFGRQYTVDGDEQVWLRAVLTELARVTRPGGRLVLLVPELPSAALPAGVRLRERHPIRLLGARTTIWSLGIIGS